MLHYALLPKDPGRVVTGLQTFGKASLGVAGSVEQVSPGSRDSQWSCSPSPLCWYLALSGATGTKIRIADISFSVLGLSRDWVWVDRELFEAFVSDSPSDVVLRVHAGAPEEHVPRGHPVRSVEGLRNVYLDENTWAFQFRPDDRTLYPRRPPHQVLLFNRDFAAGDLYVSADVMSKRRPFEFGLFLLELLTAMLPFHRGMMLHASGISDGGQAIVFAGPSGAGKSTLARLWQGCEGVRLLNDDRTILRRSGGQWRAYPVAGMGEMRPLSSEGSNLGAIFLVSQANDNNAERKGISQAASSILPHISLAYYDSVAVNLGLQLLDDLLQEVPVYELGFLPDQTAVSFVRDVVRQRDLLE